METMTPLQTVLFIASVVIIMGLIDVAILYIIFKAGFKLINYLKNKVQKSSKEGK